MWIWSETLRAKCQNAKRLAEWSYGKGEICLLGLRLHQPRSFHVLLLLILLAFDPHWVGQATTSQQDGIRPRAKERDFGSQKGQDWKALDLRWNSLIEQRNKPDAAKWSALDDDFHTFAKKYDLHLEEHANGPNHKGQPAQHTAWDFAQCPSRDDVPGYRCNLFLGPKGVCRYVCVPLSQK